MYESNHTQPSNLEKDSKFKNLIQDLENLLKKKKKVLEELKELLILCGIHEVK